MALNLVSTLWKIKFVFQAILISSSSYSAYWISCWEVGFKWTTIFWSGYWRIRGWCNTKTICPLDGHWCVASILSCTLRKADSGPWTLVIWHGGMYQ
jgi:hypothetical protein